MHRALAVSLALLGIARAASGHDVSTHLTPDGLSYLNDHAAQALPSTLEIDDISVELYECEDDDNATVTQRNTVVDIDIATFALEQPEAGVIRIELEFSASATGELFIDNPFLCAGELDCVDSATFTDIHVTIDLAADGSDETITVTNVDLSNIGDENVELTIRDCALGTLGTELLGIAEGIALGQLEKALRKYTEEKLGPMLTGAIGDLARQDLELGQWNLKTEISEIDMRAGIRLVGDIDITGDRALACFADPGEPAAHPGPRPNVLEGAPTHFATSINLGLLDDLFYHVWSSSGRCEGSPMDGSFIGDYLTEFPSGTTWRTVTNVKQPFRVTASDNAAADLTLVIPEIEIELKATLPNGEERVGTATIAAEAQAAATVDPNTATLRMAVLGARVTDIRVDDELDLAEQGFDAARIGQLVNDHYLPQQLDSFLADDVVVPLGFGGSGLYTIVRDLSTSSAYLTLKADLFVAPANDDSEPDTEITDAPSQIVRPEDAFVYVSGRDAEIPSELLSYKVTQNGIEMPDTRLGWVQVGVRGATNTYLVEVAAQDLAGNVDSSPATVEVTVDGIRPSIQILQAPSAGNSHIEFYVADDLSDISDVDLRLEIVDLDDSSEGRTRLVELAAGTTKAKLAGLQGGHSYRVTLIATDEAGNEAVSSHAFDAPNGGCSSTGGATGSVLVILLALALVAMPRRRRSWLVALALAGACNANTHDEVPETAELPECSSDLGRAMLDRMLGAAHNTTVPIDLLVGQGAPVDPRVYITGPEIFGKWASLIESAEAEVSMQFYKWEPETDPTETILGGLKALEQRRRAEGATQPVDINIVIDTSTLGVAAPITGEHMPWVMEQFAGYELDPEFLNITFAVNERSVTDQFGNLHVKTMVVDGHVGILTGANPEAQHNTEGAWHDIGTVFYGDAAHQLLADFDYTWADAQQWQCPPGNDNVQRCLVPVASIEHKYVDRPVPQGSEVACAILALTREPSSFANNEVDNPQDQAYLAALATADSVIKIETPNINDDHAKEAILAAVNRGVEVRLITSKEFNEVSEGFVGGPNGDNIDELYRQLQLMGHTELCDRLKVRWYSRDGVEPIVGNGPFASHVKYASFDNQVVIVGTTNMDTASWNFSHELNFAVDDATITAHFDSQLFDADWSRAIPVDQCQ